MNPTRTTNLSNKHRNENLQHPHRDEEGGWHVSDPDPRGVYRQLNKESANSQIEEATAYPSRQKAKGSQDAPLEPDVPYLRQDNQNTKDSIVEANEAQEDRKLLQKSRMTSMMHTNTRMHSEGNV